jgi:hypothetical protein
LEISDEYTPASVVEALVKDFNDEKAIGHISRNAVDLRFSAEFVR